MDFNKILDCLGHFGRFQAFVYGLVCIVQLFVGIHMLANVFLMAEPKHRCFIPQCDNLNSSYQETWLSFAIPKVPDDDGKTSLSQCEQFNRTTSGRFSCAATDFSNDTVSCQRNSFVWDSSEYEDTVISEFKVICKKSWSAAASQSSFMAGGLLGSAGFGFLADRYGRQKIILTASVILAVSSVGVIASPNFIGFSAIRFITAASINGLFTAAFIVGVEFIGTSKRLLCANVIQTVFALGELVLALCAYYVRSWKLLELTVSIPTVILLTGVNWFLPESVRWLIAKGRIQEAKEIILKAAKWNKRTVPEHLLEISNDSRILETNTRSKPIGPLALFGPQLRIWSLTIFFNWIVNAMVYYGISLNAANFGGNAYSNFAALSAVEIPAVLLATLFLYRYGRRLPLCVVMVVGGLACGATIFVSEGLQWLSILLVVIGKGSIAASFAIIYIYSAEIFPTAIRSTGLGISSTLARIGSIVAPLINESRKVYEPLPMIIFAVSSIAAGISALVLPETHNKQLPETIEDVEKLSRSVTTNLRKTESTVSLKEREISEEVDS